MSQESFSFIITVDSFPVMMHCISFEAHELSDVRVLATADYRGEDLFLRGVVFSKTCLLYMYTTCCNSEYVALLLKKVSFCVSLCSI